MTPTTTLSVNLKNSLPQNQNPVQQKTMTEDIVFSKGLEQLNGMSVYDFQNSIFKILQTKSAAIQYCFTQIEKEELKAFLKTLPFYALREEGFFYIVEPYHMILSSTKSNKGYCYIGIDSKWNGCYKIGKTKDISCKSRKSRAYAPNYEIIYRTNLLENYNKTEKEIHTYLKSKKIKLKRYKEWFSLTNEELQDVLQKFNFSIMEN